MSQLKNKFADALQTLLVSWGGDTPPEAMWAFNQFLSFWWDLKSIEGDCPSFTDDYYLDSEKAKIFCETMIKLFPDKFAYLKQGLDNSISN